MSAVMPPGPGWTRVWERHTTEGVTFVDCAHTGLDKQSVWLHSPQNGDVWFTLDEFEFLAPFLPAIADRVAEWKDSHRSLHRHVDVTEQLEAVEG